MATGSGGHQPGGPVEKPTKDPPDPKDPKVSPVDKPDSLLQVTGKATTFLPLAAAVVKAPSEALVVNGTLGIWPTVSANAQQKQIRQKTLGSLSFLQGGENFAMVGFPWAVKRQVDGMVKSQIAQHPEITFKNFTTAFEQPLPTLGNVVVKINGHKGIDFTLTITFSFTLAGGMVNVSPPQENLEKDTTLLDVLSVISGLFGIDPFAFAVIDAHSAGPPEVPGIANPFPSKTLVTGKQKIDYHYARLSVSETNGIVAAGTHTIDARTPKVTVSGPTSLDIHQDETDAAPGGRYTAVTDDLLAPFQQVKWSSTDKSVKILSPASLSTNIEFSLPPTFGQTVHHTFKVEVRDLEGMPASNQVQVSVTKIKSPAKQLPDNSGKSNPHKSSAGST